MLATLLLTGATLVAAPPSLTMIYPAGLQRGTEATLTLTGSADPWPCRVWISGNGVTAEPGPKPKTLIVRADAQATPGVYWLRLFNDDGASAPRPIVVSTLPTVLEKEPNNSPEEAQVLPGPNVIVDGILAQAGDTDLYAVPLKAGQTLIAAVDAERTFRSPIDALVQVLSPDGFLLDENHDARGLDPELVYTARRDGPHLVRIFALPSTPNSSVGLFGAANAIYRLTLTTAGYADHAFPPALERGKPATLRVVGWNIPASAVSLAVPATARLGPLALGHADLAHGLTVQVEPHAVVTEDEQRAEGVAQPVSTPVTIAGHIDPPGNVDAYELTLEKGQRLTAAIEARGLDAPLDPVLRLVGPDGKTIREVDDMGRDSFDPTLPITAKVPGKYRVEVRDVHGHGGPRYLYRLRITPPQPSVDLTVTTDRFALAPEGELSIPVTITRREGLTEPVTITADDLPAGVTAEPATADAKAKSVDLKLKATAAKSAGPIRIVARWEKAGDLEPTARAPVEGMEKQTTETIWLTVSPTAKPAVPAPVKKKRGTN